MASPSSSNNPLNTRALPSTIVGSASPTPVASSSPAKALEQIMLDSYAVCNPCFKGGFLVVSFLFAWMVIIILWRAIKHHWKKRNEEFDSFGFLGLSISERKRAEAEENASEQFKSAQEEQQESIDALVSSIAQLQEKAKSIELFTQLSSADIVSSTVKLDKLEQYLNTTIVNSLNTLSNEVSELSQHTIDVNALSTVVDDIYTRLEVSAEDIAFLQKRILQQNTKLNDLGKKTES